MSKDDTQPATKGDLKNLATKDELHGLRGEMMQMETRILRHFDMTVETIRHDLVGANRDEIEVIKDRVTKLEKHTGLARVS